MDMKPIYIRDSYKGSGKLQGKVAIITGAAGLAACRHAAATAASLWPSLLVPL